MPACILPFLLSTVSVSSVPQSCRSHFTMGRVIFPPSTFSSFGPMTQSILAGECCLWICSILLLMTGMIRHLCTTAREGEIDTSTGTFLCLSLHDHQCLDGFNDNSKQERMDDAAQALTAMLHQVKWVLFEGKHEGKMCSVQQSW